MSEPSDPKTEPENVAEALGLDGTLKQGDVDRILGDGTQRNRANHVIEQIVHSTMVNHDRLPMLDVVFDRLVRLLTVSLRQITSTNVDIALDRIESMRFGDYLNSVPLPAMIGVVRAEQWDNQLLTSIDAPLVYALMDVLLGGRKARPARRSAGHGGRAYTPIERRMTERVNKLLLTDLSRAFEPLCKVGFVLDRIETNPQLATVSRTTNATIRVRLDIAVEGRSGFFDVAIPYATLEPIREVLLQMFLGERFGHDPIWENHLKAELMRTRVPLVAVLHESMMPLSDVLGWQPGTSLKLEISPENPTHLQCGGVPLFVGRMGQRNERIAVQVDTDLDAKGELIDGLSAD